MEEPDQYIDFMAKYKDWVSIKRLGIRPDTKPEEIVHYLAALRTTIDNKSYSFLGIKTNILDEYAKRLSQGKRKSYNSLAEVSNSLAGSETKSMLESSCENRSLVPLAEIYLLGRVLTNLGFDTSINQTVMSKIFPGLKPPKAPGRLGKSKKKEE